MRKWKARVITLGASLTTTTLGAMRRTTDDCDGGRDLKTRGVRIVIYK
jgi:hypothetical protein